jgi:hypothetical protein
MGKSTRAKELSEWRRRGSYNTPFFPKVAFLLLGAALWLQMEPSRELFPEVLLAEGAASRLV